MESAPSDTTTSEVGPPMRDAKRRLLEAAVSAIAEHGLDATRVSDIARRAGLTTGAIYAHWSGKHELVVDAVRYIAPSCMQVDSAEGDGDDGAAGDSSVLEALIDASADLASLDNVAALEVMLEAFVSARRDSSFREAVSELLDDQAAALSSTVSDGKAAGLIEPRLSTAAIVALYQALSVGMHLVISSQPDTGRVPADEWRELMTHLAESMRPQH